MKPLRTLFKKTINSGSSQCKILFSLNIAIIRLIPQRILSGLIFFNFTLAILAQVVILAVCLVSQGSVMHFLVLLPDFLPLLLQDF